MGEQHILGAPTAHLGSSVVRLDNQGPPSRCLWTQHRAAWTCRMDSAREPSCLHPPISFKFPSSLASCSLRESAPWLSIQPPALHGVILSGDGETSIIGWLLFCPRRMSHPLVLTPGNRRRRSAACGRLAEEINSRGSLH